MHLSGSCGEALIIVSIGVALTIMLRAEALRGEVPRTAAAIGTDGQWPDRCGFGSHKFRNSRRDQLITLGACSWTKCSARGLYAA